MTEGKDSRTDKDSSTGTRRNSPMGTTQGPSPLDSLPDDVLPPDFVQAQEAEALSDRDELEPDLSPRPLSESELRSQERGRRRLLSRRLHREIDMMRKFLALGTPSAIIRTATKAEATSRRTKFYFARKQHAILANAALAQGAEAAYSMAEESDDFYGISFYIEHDDKSPFLRLRHEQWNDLEPG